MFLCHNCSSFFGGILEKKKFFVLNRNVGEWIMLEKYELENAPEAEPAPVESYAPEGSFLPPTMSEEPSLEGNNIVP